MILKRLAFGELLGCKVNNGRIVTFDISLLYPDLQLITCVRGRQRVLTTIKPSSPSCPGSHYELSAR